MDDSDQEMLDITHPDYHAKQIQRKFKQRCKALAKKQMATIVESDKRDFKDPQNLSEFCNEIYKCLLVQEEVHKISPSDYLKTVQTEIRDTQRAFLLEWIIDVHRKFKLRPETLYVCQFIVDKYLSKVKTDSKQLHLIGVTTLLIGTKYEEIYPPELKDFLQVSENKFTKKQVLEKEIEILTALDFNLTAPSAYRFLQRFRRLNDIMNNDEVFFYAQYILEISLLEASFLVFKPSVLAAAAIILASKQLKKSDPWTPEVEKQTCYKRSDLNDAVKEVKLFCQEINPKFISILKYKFSKPEYKKVSNFEFTF